MTDKRATPETDEIDARCLGAVKNRAAHSSWYDAWGVMTSHARRLESDRDRLKAANAELGHHLAKLLVYHSYAINGSKGGAQGAADVEYHFNAARAALAKSREGR